MPFAVRQEAEKQVRQCQPHLQGDHESAGLCIRQFPGLHGVHDQETGRHPAQRKDDLREQVEAEVAIPRRISGRERR